MVPAKDKLVEYTVLVCAPCKIGEDERVSPVCYNNVRVFYPENFDKFENLFRFTTRVYSDFFTIASYFYGAYFVGECLDFPCFSCSDLQSDFSKWGIFVVDGFPGVFQTPRELFASCVYLDKC